MAFLNFFQSIVYWLGYKSFFDSLNIFSTSVSATFFENFIEWFGILYGFLMPLILVRVWEQFDEIEREFDKEADAVKILTENLRLLHSTNSKHVETIIEILVRYIEHVREKYKFEASDRAVRSIGDKILREIRINFKDLIHPEKGKRKEPDSLIAELIKQLDNIIDVRGDRISLSNERLFDVLRTISLVTSIMFLVPFYFVGFAPGTGLLENSLIFGVTILVILIYIILDDLDDPFGGIWKIEPHALNQVLLDIKSENIKN